MDIVVCTVFVGVNTVTKLPNTVCVKYAKPGSNVVISPLVTNVNTDSRGGKNARTVQ